MLWNRKGFTLIELLVVISIIGVLSTVAMTSLTAARKKAHDAAIMSAANSIMKAAIIDAADSQDYTAYKVLTVWLSNSSNCNSYFGSTSNPASVRAACNTILSNMGGTVTNAMYIRNWTGSNYPKLSIMVWLPGARKYYCVGSHGASSASTISGGSGCGFASGSWKCPGCVGDVNAQGA